MHRRDFLRTAGGATAVSAGAGVAGAAESGGGGGSPDFGGWFDDVPYFDGVTDATGSDTASVSVGGDANNALSFLPAAIHVDNGAEVTWEWTGEGGAHNVVHDGGDFESELTGDEGSTFSHTFEEDGIYPYFCEPHESAGMKGAIVVGTDFPTAGGNGGGGGPVEVNPEHMGVPFQAHFVGMTTLLAILMSLVFAFYTLKYGESPHTKGGSN